MPESCELCAGSCLAARIPGHRVHRCIRHASDPYHAFVRRASGGRGAVRQYESGFQRDRGRRETAHGSPSESGGEEY